MLRGQVGQKPFLMKLTSTEAVFCVNFRLERLLLPGDHSCETTSSKCLSRQTRQEISEEALENTQNALVVMINTRARMSGFVI